MAANYVEWVRGRKEEGISSVVFISVKKNFTTVRLQQ